MEKVKINNKEGIYNLNVNYSGDIWKLVLKQAEKKAVSQLVLKGFRRGQVPEKIARKYISKSRIYDLSINAIMNRAYKAAFSHDEAKNIRLLGRPRFVINQVNDEEINVSFLAEEAPALKIGEYKKIKLPYHEIKVAEKDISDTLDQLRNQFGTEEVKQGPIANGDIVYIDFEGKINGKSFASGSAKNHRLVVGSKSLIAGFEEALLGKNPKDVVNININFPENYFKSDMAGKPVHFKVIVNEIKSKVLPDDATLLNYFRNNQIKSLDDLKAEIKKDLKIRKEQAVREDLQAELLQTIIDNSKFTVSPGLVKAEQTNLKTNMINQLKSRNLTLDEYKKTSKLTDKQIDDELLEDADLKIKSILVFDEIARLEKITVPQKLLDETVARLNKTSQKKPSTQTEINDIKYRLRNDLVIDFLLRNAIIEK